MTNAFLKEALYSATGMAVERTLIRDVAWTTRKALAALGLIQDVALFGAVSEAVYWEIQERSKRLPGLKLYLGSVGPCPTPRRGVGHGPNGRPGGVVARVWKTRPTQPWAGALFARDGPMKPNEVPGIVYQAVPKAVYWACSADQNVPWNLNKDAYSTVCDPVRLFVFSAVAVAEYDVGVLAPILAGGSQHSSPPHLGLELYLGGVIG